MPVSAAIARRVSCRAYQPTPVPHAHLMQILEAARLAPSACNQQPWRFAVVRDADLRRRIVEDGFLPGARMTWALDAPVHMVIGMERSFVTHRLAPSVSGVDYPWADIGIAECAEHVLPFFEEKHPQDDRPRRAIESRRAYTGSSRFWVPGCAGASFLSKCQFLGR